jgi:5-deoxy-glucuronate isomerase
MVEEIYYFRFQGDGGYGLYRQYAADGEFDIKSIVRDGDVFLVPRGYHGPSVAVPGHHMYFLNVLAGPSPQRTMQFCDDPQQHWVRATWEHQATDPRLPMTGPAATARANATPASAR